MKSKKMVKIKSGVIQVLLGVLIVFSGCKHTLEEEGFWGAEYAVAPEDFHVIGTLTAAPLSVDFETQKLEFNATLSHKVSWSITITGATSGAKKTLIGTSNLISASNASWDGGSDNGIFFRVGENVTAVLTFLGSELSESDAANILKAKKYKGVLISDFDGAGFTSFPSDWYPYSDTVQPAKTPEVSSYQKLNVKIGSDSLIQGYYLNMKGTDLDNDWFIGGCGYWQNINLATKLAALTSDPDEIYVNLFVNGNGQANNAIGVTIFEPAGANRDIFFQNITIDWTGWKLISLKVSGMSLHPNSAGNGVPDNLSTMEFIPVPLAQGATSEINVDYIIFTKGPFQP